MKHLGDITAIHGGSIEPVDVITFGSPCQDLSVAGNRAGLDGERSGLFMEAARIIREMREATNGVYPNFAVWENVPGAFSSNHAEDFRAVLEALAQICDERTVIPRPAGGKLRTVGCIMADGWSIAWRVLDAQFWGAPQRRRRIALIVDFGGQRAPEILFERAGLRRDFAESGAARERASVGAQNGTGSAGEVQRVIPINTQIATRHIALGRGTGFGVGNEGDAAYTLEAGHSHAVMCMATGQVNTEILHDVSPTLNCDHEQPICLHPDISGTICASGAGTDRPSGKGNEGDLCIVQGNHDRRIVRRLIPLECDRLQGYPDGWTDIPPYIDSHGKQKRTSDAVRYKALGNSIAIPPWKWVLKRISAQFERDATLGSLFDGIGGFPHIWEQFNGNGSARWASEIDEFCIAVTKYHFRTE